MTRRMRDGVVNDGDDMYVIVYVYIHAELYVRDTSLARTLARECARVFEANTSSFVRAYRIVSPRTSQDRHVCTHTHQRTSARSRTAAASTGTEA